MAPPCCPELLVYIPVEVENDNNALPFAVIPPQSVVLKIDVTFIKDNNTSVCTINVPCSLASKIIDKLKFINKV